MYSSHDPSPPFNKQMVIWLYLLLFTCVFTDVCAGEKPFISQTYVDTTVQRALYLMNDAATVAGVGFKAREGIEEAKKIARHLREIARGDKNERYIKWKTSELEAQIYLEEKELMLQSVQKMKTSTNQLVSEYNREVGKNRPDFALLKSIHTRVSELDISKANDIAGSFNNRYRQISRELGNSLERAFLTGDLEKARTEVDYCMKNRRYLTINDSRFDQINARLDALQNARATLPSVSSDIEKAGLLLKETKIGEARKYLDYAQGRLADMRNVLPTTELNLWFSRSNAVRQILEQKEDSLVKTNLTILKTKGIDPANDYLQKVLRPRGVSRDKVAYVDQSILSISSPEKSAIKEEISTMTKEIDDGPGIFADIRERARQKAQEKLDSMRAAEEQRIRLIALEQARQDSIRRLSDQANALSIEIYTMLETNQLDKALSSFAHDREFLRRNLTKDAFEILELALSQSRELAIATPPAPVTVSVAPSPEKPPITPANEQLQRNRARAEAMILEIYAMLERNEIAKAYTLFQKNRAPLMRFLDKDAFTMLETTVVQANTIR